MTALTVIVFWCAYLVRDALLLVYISTLIAIGFSPLVRLIEKQKALPIGSRRFPRWFAILILYLAILGFVALLAILVFPPLVRQGQSLWAQAPAMFDHAQQYFIDKGWLQERLTLREVVAHAPGNGGDAVGGVTRALAHVAGGILGIFTILILSFYILVDTDNLRPAMLRLVPRPHRERVSNAARTATLKISAWLGGQMLLAAVLGTTTAIGLWALGVPYFYVLAMLAAVGEFIPLVGAILSAIPALAVAATVSNQKVLFVLIFFVVQHQLENHILVPKIMSRQVGVSPVTVIVALLIGADLLGVVGAILAVPTAAILQVVAAELVGDE